MKKHTVHNLTIKHKKAKHMKHHKMGNFAANRHEEEMEDEGKKKHMKHMKRKSAGMKCKECGSTAHAMHPAMMTKKHEKHMKKKLALQTNAARFERMRKKVFGLR